MIPKKARGHRPRLQRLAKVFCNTPNKLQHYATQGSPHIISGMNRREFLYASSSMLAGLGLPAAAKYDLVIKGGRALDASQRLDRQVDVAVRDGKIAALQPNIPAADAAEIFDARGRIVTAGLVDIHAHPRPGELSPTQVL